MSGRFKPAANTYVRPMGRCWRRDPFYVRYMLREATAIFVTLYALDLLIGLFCLWRGEAAYTVWLTAMRSGPAVLFHLIAFVMICYHSYTWFKVMPKTMPPVPIAPGLMLRICLAAVVCVSIATLLLVWRLGR
jgi:fumarate reductase subunit C